MRFVPSCGGSCHVGTMFIASGTHLSHQEHVCRPAHSGGSCPPVGVLIASGMQSLCHLSSQSFQRFMPSNGGSLRVLGGPSCRRIVRHPTRSVGFCPPGGFSLSSRRSRSLLSCQEHVRRVVHRLTRSALSFGLLCLYQMHS